MIIETLVIMALLLLFVVLVVLLKLSSKLERVSVNQEVIKGAVATCWKELGLDQDIGAIKERANDILKSAQSLENLFRVVRGRGEYGEFQLEQILKDILPSQYVHIRERIPKIGKIPDAHITTPNGILCIDSKFPLDNYRKMLETTDETEKEKFAMKFRKDVEAHIKKIKIDYVKPEEGTTPFAFGFIPSEAVYQYLTECEMDLVAEAAKENVLLVSPATLAINLNLLAVGLKAAEISERAEQIQRNLAKLSSSLKEVENTWSTLYNHIRNAYSKAGELDKKYDQLKVTFEQITALEEN
ncbi:MAG: DNA recombination protein RmuC [Thaumarchaeota archaeon]|nr:MAG: DNA recombination protein RmuC [Nitrososphaerota archaeon]